MPLLMRPRWNDEADRAVWKDLSGNGNDGTLSGFAFTEASGWGSDPPRLVLDGTTDYVALPNLTVGTHDVTLETWASVDHLAANNYGALINIGDPNGTYSVSILVSLNAGHYVARAYYKSPGVSLTIWAAPTSSLQHLVATFDRDGSMELFANNVSQGTAVISAGASDSHPAVASYIGHYTGWDCKCQVYTSRIYFDHLLTPAERIQNYAAGPTGWGYVRTGLVLDLNAAYVMPVVPKMVYASGQEAFS